MGLLRNAGAVSCTETKAVERRGCSMPMAPLAWLEYAVGAIGRQGTDVTTLANRKPSSGRNAAIDSSLA
jgi:hypothetical protein